LCFFSFLDFLTLISEGSESELNSILSGFFVLLTYFERGKVLCSESLDASKEELSEEVHNLFFLCFTSTKQWNLALLFDDTVNIWVLRYNIRKTVHILT
jgi:hypothetical protein